MRIGVLAIHGSVSEHVAMLRRLGHEAVPVKVSSDLDGISGLIIPGGESTTVGKFLLGGLGERIKELVRSGLPVYGTCTGMIILGRVSGREPYTLSLMDVSVKRNAFGRQVDSFEQDIVIPVLGKDPFHCVFIRAPVIDEAGEGVEVLSAVSGKVIFARDKNMLASSFHPELTDDTRVHEYFLRMCGSR